MAVSRSDLRWCSDGLEIRCDSGQTVTATFAKDCCDRGVMAWRAWEGKGLPVELVRKMLIEALERRFGTVEAVPTDHAPEFLSDKAVPTSGPKHGRWHARWAESPIPPGESRGRHCNQRQADLEDRNGPASGGSPSFNRARNLLIGCRAL